ncbi:MAG: hypothetical protein ACRDOI_39175, partial [Trebonia sp.]
PVPPARTLDDHLKQGHCAVRPPEIDSTVVLKVSWVEFDFSAPLIKSADAIAQTLEIQLRDA